MATEVMELELDGWRALSTSPAAATAFYGEVLADEVVMLLPGGLRLTDRQEVLESMGGQPWDRFEIDAMEGRDLGGVVVVYYGVVAARGATDYSALVASVYAKDAAGAWRLVTHQHTPR